ncbi:hypothetical protein CPT_Machias_242 [Staphylococcus phage Machias]|nr:hypothetical protein CPT_Machias_242 [Staphylococcus phage Machias]
MDIIDLKKNAKMKDMEERLGSVENCKNEINKNLNVLLTIFDNALIKETSKDNFIYDKKSDTISIKSVNSVTSIDYPLMYSLIKEIISLFKSVKKSLGIDTNQYTHTFKDGQNREYEIISDLYNDNIILTGKYKFNISHIQFNINGFKEVTLVIK